MKLRLISVLSLFSFFLVSNICAHAQAPGKGSENDTSFVFMSVRYCSDVSESTKYINERNYPGDLSYTVRKIKGRFSLQKQVYHNEYERPDGGGHLHTFRAILLDSFPPLEQPLEDIRLVQSEQVKPFTTRSIESTGQPSEFKIEMSHDCLMKIIFKINSERIECEVPKFPIMAVDTLETSSGTPQIRYNIYYSYNQALKSVKAIIYMQNLIGRLEKEGRFRLIK